MWGSGNKEDEKLSDPVPASDSLCGLPNIKKFLRLKNHKDTITDCMGRQMEVSNVTFKQNFCKWQCD